MEDLDTRISQFLQNADLPSIDLGNFVGNAKEMGLSTATAIAIARANPNKAAELVSLLADFLTEIDANANGMVVSDVFIAAQLLGQFGPTASPAIPALEDCIRLDGSEYDLIRWLRLMAAEAKWRITGDPTAALSVATELLDDEEWWLVGHAADLLGDLGQAAQPAVAHLQRLLNHENEDTRMYVRAAIERIRS